MGSHKIQNIRTDFGSYQQLIELYHQNKHSLFEVIEIELEEWFGANMSAVLGGLLDLLELKSNEVRFRNLPTGIETIIRKNDFLSHFGFPKLEDRYHTTIPYLKLKPTDSRFFHRYMMDGLLERPELPSMTPALRKKIGESIYEIFVNAQIHSGTTYIYSCGQFFPNKHLIEFTIVDTGIGFRDKINNRFHRNLTAVQAIEWATTDGHSTKEGISGGIGLAILKEFVQKNKGKFQIVSDRGFYEMDGNRLTLKDFPRPFPGTVVTMQFRTDDTLSYALAGEPATTDIF